MGKARCAPKISCATNCNESVELPADGTKGNICAITSPAGRWIWQSRCGSITICLKKDGGLNCPGSSLTNTMTHELSHVAQGCEGGKYSGPNCVGILYGEIEAYHLGGTCREFASDSDAFLRCICSNACGSATTSCPDQRWGRSGERGQAGCEAVCKKIAPGFIDTVRRRFPTL